jgi:S1-C subfamily serine protease
MGQLIANKGVVRRGTLGVETQDVDARLAKALGLADARGAAVTRVLPDSAAAAAGLRAGDVIVGANGQRIDDGESLRNFQGLQSPDAKVHLDVVRDGKPLQLLTGLREAPRDGGSLDPRLAGASFGELPEALRRQGASGVLVSAVAPGSRAARNGLRDGDVILAATSGGFDDLDSFRASFARSPRQLVLTVWRGGQRGQLLMQ